MNKISMSIALGILDALLPYIKESIKEKESDFMREAPKLSIDWARLTSALVTFTLLILCIFDFITAKDIFKILQAWNVLLQ